MLSQRLLPLAVVLALAVSSRANMMSVDYHGVLGGDSTIGGTALGSDTAFEFRADFDPAADLTPLNGFGVFAAQNFQLQILSGAFAGTYTAPANPTLNVLFTDSNYYLPSVSLSPGGENYAWLWWGQVTLAPDGSYDADAPTDIREYHPTQGAGPYGYGLPYTIGLDGPQGDLVINSIGDDASLTSATFVAVPEPATPLVGFACALVAGIAGISRRRRMAGR